MGAKSNIVVGLDIGTSTISVVIAELIPEASSKFKVNVIGAGSSPSKGLRKGVVINIEGTVSSIADAVSQAETMAGREVQSVLASISGSHIQGLNSHGIVGIKNKEVSHRDIERVIEAAKAVAIPLDREILHVLPQEFIIDEQDGIKEPLGISGVRLESRVHIVTGSVASAQNIVKCANRCGLNVQDIVLASLASGRAVVTPEEQELGVCLLDIGGGTCDLTVFHNGAVKHTSVISVGGNHITNDIAAGLRTPISAAENIKCRYGTAMISLVSKDQTIEVPSTGGRPPRVLSKLVLSEIVEPRVMEIFSMVHKDLLKSGCDEMLTSGLVLTGGTSKLDGIAEVAEQVFNLPVRVAEPMGIGGLTDIVCSAEYAAAVGLVLHGAHNQTASRLSSGANRVGQAVRKVSNWFSEHF